ncbi:hypothetical protein [Desulfosporosinus sp. FKA]|uniref:hypothetical protein n=1 Tax=Desulfosporosinus sp. FKA TaxID=1969834 RepID=UPI000B498046|nr:hypothetical protein [Desulfosporosinus sp. FKA]
MDEETFRRELYFATNFPETIAEIKRSKQFKKMDLARQYAFYDNLYKTHKELFLSGYVSEDEKQQIQNTATEQIMNRGLEELEKSLQQ